MSWSVSSANATLPFTLTEAKLWLKVDNSDEDDLITDLIEEVKDAAEGHLDTYLYNTTITEYLDAFPDDSDPIYLSVCEVSSVTSITYTDIDGNTGQTFSSSSYVVDNTGVQPKISLANNESWPSTLEEAKTVTVTYVVGYGASAGDEPAKVRKAMRLMLSEIYHNRGDRMRAKQMASEYLLNWDRKRYF